MHAMVSWLRFRDSRGPVLEALELEKQRKEIEMQTGFRALYAIRASETEMLIVRIYDTDADLRAGFRQGIRPSLGDEFERRPQRWDGEVVVSVEEGGSS
jgi:hypothetical protein